MKKLTELYATGYHNVYAVDGDGGAPVIVGNKPYKNLVPLYTGSRVIRFVHFCIDGFIVLMLTLAILIHFKSLKGLDNFYLVYALCYVAYYLLFESLFHTSIAKMVTRRVIVDEYGNPIGFVAAVTRTLVRCIFFFDAFSFFYNRVGWHDKWAGTYVIGKRALNERLALIKDQETFIIDSLLTE